MSSLWPAIWLIILPMYTNFNSMEIFWFVRFVSDYRLNNWQFSFTTEDGKWHNLTKRGKIQSINFYNIPVSDIRNKCCVIQWNDIPLIASNQGSIKILSVVNLIICTLRLYARPFQSSTIILVVYNCSKEFPINSERCKHTQNFSYKRKSVSDLFDTI